MGELCDLNMAPKKKTPAKKTSAKKPTPAKKTPAKKPTPAKKSAAKAKPQPKLRKGMKPGVPESSSGSAWEQQAMKISGSRKRKASDIVGSSDLHRGSIPAQGTKPLKKSKPAKKEKTVKSASVVPELKQILKTVQAALAKVS